MTSKRVKFEFDERSVKTLEQMTEEGYVSEGGVLTIPEPVSVFGCDGRVSQSHAAAQIASRDAEITRLEADNVRLSEIVQVALVFKAAADDLKIKNAFNTALWRDLEAKREAEKKLLEALRHA